MQSPDNPKPGDDDAWLAALAGRDPAGADAKTVTEARAMREAMLEARGDVASADDATERNLQRLLFRLRKERLLDDARAPRRWLPYAGIAVAASLALTTALIVFQREAPDDDSAVMRGDGTQTIARADPKASAAALVAVLRDAGLKPTLIEFGDTLTVTADWPAQPDARQRAALAQHGLKPPRDGRLRVEIRRTR
ncbi:MAG: hypothetical protein K8S22_15155 [Betaproteobacteria bacterium]|nr:hypothetical protein [Betaproteobacteria bacterium]